MNDYAPYTIMKRKTRQRPPASNEIIFRIAQLFFEGSKVSKIRDTVNEEFHLNPPLSRESVYPLLQTARRKGFVRLVPPIEDELGNKFCEQFKIQRDRVRVVVTPNQQANHAVAAAAADQAMELLAELSRQRKEAIGVGLGPGRAALDFSTSLGERLQGELEQHLMLDLHAISAGCPATSPEYSPMSFFNLFPRDHVRRRIGMFAEPLVRAVDFNDQFKNRPGLREAFRSKQQISLIATAMGDMVDEHDLLRTFLAESGVDPEQLIQKGWYANVQYRPYREDGPVEEASDELRAVTLFELCELVAMAERKDRYIILIARQCGACGKTRARALRPLLVVPQLRVFSHICMDAATCRELLSTSPN